MASGVRNKDGEIQVMRVHCTRDIVHTICGFFNGFHWLKLLDLRVWICISWEAFPSAAVFIAVTLRIMGPVACIATDLTLALAS